MKKLLYYFIQGLFYTAPIGVTLYVLYRLFVFVDSWFAGLFKPAIPGLGIVLTITAVTVLGFIGGTVIARPMMEMLNRFITRLPIIKEIYVPLKDFFAAFVGKEKKFTAPVLVKINNISNLEKLGFLTQKDLSELKVEGTKVAVYFPHSYAFSGEMYIVPSEFVTPLDIQPSEAMKFILTGGAVKNFTNETKKEI
ncbi:MAG: DUF502 domain-containing protein [Bacteroidia bacterium]|nr:DUF502 domain-containing protein [Bacteroidia bacterium]